MLLNTEHVRNRFNSHFRHLGGQKNLPGYEKSALALGQASCAGIWLQIPPSIARPAVGWKGGPGR
eukprot:gene10902-7560_t